MFYVCLNVSFRKQLCEEEEAWSMYFCVEHVSKWTLLSLPLNIVSVPAVHAAHFVPTHLIKWPKAEISLNKVLLVRKHFKRSFSIAFLVHWSALHAQYQSEKLFISYTNVL